MLVFAVCSYRNFLMNSELPTISVIIPAFNASDLLGNCLDSVVNQEYPTESMEILVIDDNSVDNSVEVAKGYGAKIFVNGSRNIEMGKSIGLRNAKNDLVFFLDADNILPERDWLKKAVAPFIRHSDLVGSEASWFKYRKEDSITDRYCSLFGVNDPLVFYLGRRDKLMQTERDWFLAGKVVANYDDYFLVQFDENNLLTVGSQGFIAKRESLLKTDYTPYFFHIDSNMDLVRMGYDTFAMMKLEMIHLHSEGVLHFLRKLKRNFGLFLAQRHLRRYKYETHAIRLFFTILSMVTLIRPVYDSLKGFFRKRDVAWFLHPLFCFIVPIMYLSMAVTWKLLSLGKAIDS